MKTWTEYLNRLLGVVVGFEVFLIMSLSLLEKQGKKTAALGLSLFLLVGFQGLLGAKVVSSHLSPSLISLHMLVAMVILFLLLELALMTQRSKKTPFFSSLSLSSLQKSYGCLLLMALVQLLLGTQGREQIDLFLHREIAPDRSLWYGSLTGIFYAHRFWAYVLACYFIFHLVRYRKLLCGDPTLRTINMLSILVMTAHLLSGMAFKHLNFPIWNQPLHLLLAGLSLSLFYLGFRPYLHYPLLGALKCR